MKVKFKAKPLTYFIVISVLLLQLDYSFLERARNGLHLLELALFIITFPSSLLYAVVLLLKPFELRGQFPVIERMFMGGNYLILYYLNSKYVIPFIRKWLGKEEK